MRICHVGPIPFGEDLPDFEEQPRELARAGADVHVICAENRRREDATRPPGLTIHEVGLGRTLRGWVSPRWVRHVSTLLKEISPDVVHVYAFRGAFLLPLLFRGPAWVFDLRTGSIASRLLATIGNWTSRFESASYDLCLTIHEGLASRVWGRNYRRVCEVVPLGTDFGRFNPTAVDRKDRMSLRRTIGFRDQDVGIIYIGAFDKRRKPSVILDVAERLADIQNLRWFVAGYGSETNALIKQVEARRIGGYVRVAERIDYSRAHLFYGAADVGFAYVPATYAYDCQPPLKTIEMLASGLPVVATATRGNSMFVRDGETGLLSPDSAKELANHLRRVVAGLQVFRGNVLRHRPELERYSWKRIVADQLLPIYARLLERQKRPGFMTVRAS